MKLNKRLSVLYADGNEESCLMLKTLLGFSGIDVLCVNTGKEAFQAVRDIYFDLYLLESRLPDESGLELCQRLHKFSPETPIVFYSGDGYESDCQKGLAAGASAYLIKPDSDKVASTIFKFAAQVTQTN